MQKILISACLMGENVRYDGGNVLCENVILKQWHLEKRLVSICPELLGGLLTPRPPAEIKNQQVVTAEGVNVTKAYNEGAAMALKTVHDYKIKLAILKENSPSCGSSFIYDGTFSGKKIKDQGFTTKLLETNGIKVFSENEIESAKKFLESLDN